MDGISHDGHHGIVVIALVGNPFSPAYARARKKNPRAQGEAFSAMNVAIYGPSARWSLTEQPLGAIHSSGMQIGKSSMRWDEKQLVIEIDELASPRPLPCRGTIRFTPRVRSNECVKLDTQGQHLWWPVAPRGDIEVDLDQPGLRFRGNGYHDANEGAEPLESAFSAWEWARAHHDDQTTEIVYRARERTGSLRATHLSISHHGDVTHLADAGTCEVARGAWGIARWAPAPVRARPRLVDTWEDTPFYVRSVLETDGDRGPVQWVHESLSLDRFRSAWVQFLLGFRMGRST